MRMAPGFCINGFGHGKSAVGLSSAAIQIRDLRTFAKPGCIFRCSPQMSCHRFPKLSISIYKVKMDQNTNLADGDCASQCF